MLPVLGHRVGANGQQWLHVSLPGRPNGRSGWIAQRATIAKSTPWHIVVDIRARRVTVYDRGRSILNVCGVLGTAGSHGCVRLSTKMMLWLALRMGPGTPVTIRS